MSEEQIDGHLKRLRTRRDECRKDIDAIADYNLDQSFDERDKVSVWAREQIFRSLEQMGNSFYDKEAIDQKNSVVTQTSMDPAFCRVMWRAEDVWSDYRRRMSTLTDDTEILKDEYDVRQERYTSGLIRVCYPGAR